MNVRRIFLALILLPTMLSTAFADKGMWVLQELNKQNIERMRELGFTMPIDQLYNLKSPSLVNSVVIFGRGCTGVTVSDKGLIFTNHHCGYDAIQSQSTVEHDYLQDGFVSQDFKQELPIPGLTVKYLRDVVDVTDRIESIAKGAANEMERFRRIGAESEKIEAEYAKDDFTSAEVVPFYEGNKYYVVVYNVFRDVRLVMTPPSSVGKFGGDTDNWMWPRHTGDFSVFRVYADANNKPAEYSINNKPYKPIYHAKVSLNGYKPGDYSMTIGFPGSTERYLTSWALKDKMQNEHDPRIEVRGAKQEIWKAAMEADQATRIMYAAKYSQSANYWKNAIGMNLGVENLKLIPRKEAEEKAFDKWVKENNKSAEYGNILSELKTDYSKVGENNKKLTYLYEALIGGTEVPLLANYANQYAQQADLNSDEAKHFAKYIEEKYKDYSPALDRKVLPAMLDIVRKHGGAEMIPNLYSRIDKKYGGSSDKYAEYVFNNSVVPYKDKLNATMKLAADKRKATLEKDPAVELWNDVVEAYRRISVADQETQFNIQKNKRLYFAAMRQMNPDALMPSDANFTMRLSYGSVGGYAPKDGAYYNYYTTQKGVFEKENPNSSEFRVQPEIINLLKHGDFGQYGENGELRLCFLSNNDITGGNSGSPVFDKNGDLIGLAFDGNWEAMSGDLEFEPELQRTISVDIRYVLFMIDKWAKCQRLVDEITFVPKAEKSCCKVANNATLKKDNCTKACKSEAKAGKKECCKAGKDVAKAGKKCHCTADKHCNMPKCHVNAKQQGCEECHKDGKKCECTPQKHCKSPKCGVNKKAA